MNFTTKIQHYPEWTAYLKDRQPKTLIVWGRNDPLIDHLDRLPFHSAWRGGGDESEVFSDYKDFSGWMIPTRIERKEPKRTITEVVNSHDLR